MTESASSDVETTPKKRNKGIRHPETYRFVVQKNKRLRGEEYVSISTDATVPAKSNANRCCSCKNKCTEKLSLYEKKHCLKVLHNLQSKNLQDTYLMGLIDRTSPSRRRSKSEAPLKRDNVFVYHVMKDTERVTVCKNAFSMIYCVGNKALFRLTSLIAAGKSAFDNRGRHGHRGNAIPENVRALIDEHIKEFPVKETHYSNKNIKYLSAELNIKTLYELFCKKHPNLSSDVKYDFFRNHFRENHNFRFGRPQIDVCSTCEELTAKIKSPHLNETAKRAAVAEKVVHLRRAKKFYKKQQEIKELCSNNPEVGAIVFDFMQNLPLPKIPVQEMFYLRKLWLYVFCVHNIKTGSADFYVYPEGEAKRGPDEVCSMLWLNIQNMSPDIKELHVFSDACGGQNRNNTLVRFFLALVATGRFSKIYQYFPVRGHSFLQCDRNFGTAKRKIRRMDRIYSTEQYVDLIKASKKSGFHVTQISADSVLDFKNWWPKLYKKSTKSGDKSSFLISTYTQLEYTLPAGYLTTSKFIDGFVKHTFFLQKPNTLPQIPTDKAYKKKIPINHKKIQDVAKIVTYIPDEFKKFYEVVITRPTTEMAQDGDSEGEQ